MELEIRTPQSLVTACVAQQRSLPIEILQTPKFFNLLFRHKKTPKIKLCGHEINSFCFLFLPYHTISVARWAVNIRIGLQQTRLPTFTIYSQAFKTIGESSLSQPNMQPLLVHVFILPCCLTRDWQSKYQEFYQASK